MQLDRDGAVLPAARARLRQLLPGAAEGIRQPEHIFTRVRLFLVLLDELGRARPALLRDDHRRGSASARDSLVVELASNDGYLLQHFLPLGVPVLGIEPAANVAKVAIDKGIPTLVEFFGVELAAAARRRRARRPI